MYVIFDDQASMKKMVFTINGKFNVSSSGLLRVNGWDQKASFQRLCKQRLGMSKGTDNDQVKEF